MNIFNEILKAVNSHDPSYDAYRIAQENPEYRKWAENIIENDKIGDPAWAAYFMVKYCGSEREWAEKIIENVNGNHISRAEHMVKHCGSSKEWYKRVTNQDYDKVKQK